VTGRRSAVLLLAGLASVLAPPGRAAGGDGDHAAGGAGEAPGASFDYLYVEANEGGSAGGHVAVRFGPDTYHFQYAQSGLLEMERTRSPEFLAEYVLLSNRTVHVSRVGVDPETLASLRRTFDRRYWRERRDQVRLERLARSRAWLEPTGVRVPVAGAGYFGDTPSQASARLRARIRSRHGDEVLERRTEEARDALARALENRSPELPTALVDAGSSLTAVDLVRRARGLTPGGLVTAPDPSWHLDQADRARVAALRAALEDRLVALVVSRRADWGTPFVVGLARLLSLDASLASGRLVFLDIHPVDGPSFTPRGEPWRRMGPELSRQAERDFDAARRRVLGGAGWRELEYARLEESANHLAELRRGIEGGVPIRLARERGLPAREGKGALVAGVPIADLSRELERRHDRVRESLERGRSYHVIARNCVSAVFETIDQTMAGLAGEDSGEAIRRESVRRLGGHVRPDASLAFIPFVSSREVRERYRVVGAFSLLSNRQAQLRRMRGEESDVWVYLRESNVLTSTLYQRGRGDSLFLFFTEDGVLVRPVLGAFNLAVGIAGGVAGVLWAPVDGGDLLVDGLFGALASLPELFFVNIRKGSNDYVLTGAEREDLAGDLAF